MRIRVISDKETKTWGVRLIDLTHREILEIVTWKGVYVIDNKQPSLGAYLVGPIWYRQTTLKREDNGLRSFKTNAWNPVSKKWFDGNADIFVDIIEWALKQDPSPDFDGAKEDKIEVEEVFSKM